jgi:hypothetical protein
MSAFVCQPEHIGLLAAFLATDQEPKSHVLREEKATRFAITLARQNIDSVAYRYPGDKDGERPGPAGLKDQQIIDLAGLWAVHFANNPPQKTLTEIIKFAHCLDYQSCETDDYKTTNAADLIRQIIYAACRNRHDYEPAAWEYNAPAQPASVIEYLEETL